MDDLLLVKYSDGRILFGKRDDDNFLNIAFGNGLDDPYKDLDIVETMLTNNEDLQKIFGEKVSKENKDLLKKLFD